MSEVDNAISMAFACAKNGEHEKQKEICEKYLQRVLDSKSKDLLGYRAPLYAGLLDAYIKMGQFNRVGKIAEKAIADKYSNAYSDTFFYGCLCAAKARRGEHDAARKYGKKYKEGLRFLMNHSELVQNVPFLIDVFESYFYEMVDSSIYMEARPIYPRRSQDEPIMLSISLLTSNRKDTIRKCLDSMQHLREVVPSELVIVDTGCDAEMRSIIEEYTDKIVKFEWCNDFAAARNAGLARCIGNWLLFIDDDEWFEDTDAIEQFFLSGEYRNYDKAYYKIRNYGDTAGNTYSDNEILRISALLEETHFRGKIHEQLQPYSENVKRLDSFVHHFGYAFDTEEENVRHGYRNIIPMIEAVEEEPYDINMKIHLAHGYFNTSEFRSLEEVCEEAIRQIPNPEDEYLKKYYSGFCGGYVCALCNMGFYDKTIEACDKLLATPLTKMGQLTLYRWKAHAAYRLKLVDLCLDAVSHYEKLMEEFRRDPDSFYKGRMHMTEGALQEEEVIQATREAATDGVFMENQRDVDRRANYAQMVQLEEDKSNDFQLAKLYYIESELCRQERFCKEHMEAESENYAFYCLGYVDAIFTECRYDTVLQILETLKGEPRLSEADWILLYCEGCVAAFRQKEYTLAHRYGVQYQQALAVHKSDIDPNILFLQAAIQDFNQERIQEILDMLVPESEQRQSTEQSQPQDEMRALAKQIKEQARAMMQVGNIDMACDILSQLLAMMPDDEEAKALLESGKKMQ